MGTIKLYHGSTRLIETPSLLAGRPNNDYGRGFYCTRDILLAGEWACQRGEDGFINCYELEARRLTKLNLNSSDYTILNWLATLLTHRTFRLDDALSREISDYIISNFSVDYSDADFVIGYRADDSYFSYAQRFLENRIPLHFLNKAMHLGNLGEQTVLLSEKAFLNLRFRKSIPASALHFHQAYQFRDQNARLHWRQIEMKCRNEAPSGLYALDILRRRLKNDSKSIQRNLSF